MWTPLTAGDGRQAISPRAGCLEPHTHGQGGRLLTGTQTYRTCLQLIPYLFLPLRLGICGVRHCCFSKQAKTWQL